MPLTGAEDHRINPQVAHDMTQRYRKANTTGFSKTLGGFFSKPEILRLLSQPGSIGIRYYFALDSNSNLCIVLSATDNAGNDMVYPDALAEYSVLCPNECSTPNILNTD
jgi:hypothetical protein